LLSVSEIYNLRIPGYWWLFDDWGINSKTPRRVVTLNRGRKNPGITLSLPWQVPGHYLILAVCAIWRESVVGVGIGLQTKKPTSFHFWQVLKYQQIFTRRRYKYLSILNNSRKKRY
jgi:hypothetical protein